RDHPGRLRRVLLTPHPPRQYRRRYRRGTFSRKGRRITPPKFVQNKPLLTSFFPSLSRVAKRSGEGASRVQREAVGAYDTRQRRTPSVSPGSRSARHLPHYAVASWACCDIRRL